MQGMSYKATEKPLTTSANPKLPTIRANNRKPWCCRRLQNQALKSKTPKNQGKNGPKLPTPMPPSERDAWLLRLGLEIWCILVLCSLYCTEFASIMGGETNDAWWLELGLGLVVEHILTLILYTFASTLRGELNVWYWVPVYYLKQFFQSMSWRIQLVGAICRPSSLVTPVLDKSDWVTSIVSSYTEVEPWKFRTFEKNTIIFGGYKILVPPPTPNMIFKIVFFR